MNFDSILPDLWIPLLKTFVALILQIEDSGACRGQ